MDKKKKKKKLNSRDNYLCVIITLSPNRRKKYSWERQMIKTATTKWRSKKAHDKAKEAHTNKIK